MSLRTFLSRVHGLFRRSSLDRRLEEEIHFHLEMEKEKNRSRGLSAQDALAQARRAFGAREQMKEIYREQRGLPMIETAIKDLRYAIRGFRKSPGFTAIVLMSLTLGIGANTAIFTLIDAVMLRGLPVRSPGELVTVGDASKPTAFWHGGPMANILSYPLYRRLQQENRAFTELLASGNAGRLEVGLANGGTEQAHGRLVSGNYFDVLGVSPIAGRTFSAQEDRIAGASPVVVISYEYWADRFGRSFDILGKTFWINGSPFTVIGIAPPGFSGEVVGSPTDIWIPLCMQAQVNPGDPRLDSHDANWLLCIGRLKPGVSIGSARAEMTALVHNALIDYEGAGSSPDKIREIRSEKVDVEPGSKGFSWIRTHDASLLFTLMALVGLVLLIACTNVANLLLARGTSRQKEISMRLALGADRLRIIRQMLTEAALLAGIAAVAGVLLAWWGSRFLSQLVSGSSGIDAIPFEVDVKPDMAVLGFNAAITFLTVILFGLVPALRSTRIDLLPALKENAQTVSQGRWRLGSALVMGQLALSTVILIGAGLFLRSLEHLNSLNVGYSRNKVIVMSADLSGSGYPAAQRLPATRRLIDFLRAIPGVSGVTVSTNGLFTHSDSNTDSLSAEGFVPTRKDDSFCSFDQIGPHYFRVLGVLLIAGREFDEHDRASTSNDVVINETMARFYFANADPIGRRLRNGGDRYTVIGVVKDMKEGKLKSPTERRFYGPLFQTTDPIQTLYFEIKTRAAAGPMIAAIRREIQAFDPNLKVSSIVPVSVLIEQDLNGDRLITKLSGFFGILVLLLAANGLYGVISYTTARRTSEIGLRMAIGADRGDVIRMVLSETVFLILAGLAIGLPAALAATRLLRATLAGVTPSDPATIGVVILIMLVAGILAGYIPAARAARVDPMAALREQ
jgi:putative ABC transport system permease protein